MSTELLIDGAIITLAALYLGVGAHWFKVERKQQREHDRHMAALDKTAARARQVRKLVEERFWQ